MACSCGCISVVDTPPPACQVNIPVHMQLNTGFFSIYLVIMLTLSNVIS